MNVKKNRAESKIRLKKIGKDLNFVALITGLIMDKEEFLYPRHHYNGKVNPENLVFNACLTRVFSENQLHHRFRN